MKRGGIWRKLKKRVAVLTAVFVFGCVGRTYAAEECRLMQISIEEHKLISYVECGGKVEGAEAQVAQSACENVEVIRPEDISVHTIILLDNSLSVSESNRENIKSILKQYFQEIQKNETISFAVFGEELLFLIEKSQNMDEMLQVIEKLEFHDQNTYLTDYLYEVLDKIEKDCQYTRLIIISDGVDNREVGITKDELMSRLGEISRPVYTIGHIYKDNSDELKNMFALSRVTGGQEFLIEDYEDLNQISAEIHNLTNIYLVKTDIPQNVMDGGKKNILLRVHTESGDAEVTGAVSMPFALVEDEPVLEDKKESETIPEPTPEPEPIQETEPEQEVEQKPIPEPIPVQEPESTGVETSKIIGIIVAVAAAIVLVVYQKKSKQKKKQLEANVSMPQKEPEEDVTEILDGRYLLVLRDRDNLERIFRYPLDNHVIVGRNTDMVQIAIDYNLTVSGQHCEFYMKKHRFFIQDMNSANHTYLDGKIVTGETEIISGSTIRLGEVEFSVEIMPI